MRSKCRKKWSWLNLRQPIICLVELSKTVYYISLVSWSPGWDLNSGISWILTRNATHLAKTFSASYVAWPLYTVQVDCMFLISLQLLYWFIQSSCLAVLSGSYHGGMSSLSESHICLLHQHVAIMEISLLRSWKVAGGDDGTQSFTLSANCCIPLNPMSTSSSDLLSLKVLPGLVRFHRWNKWVPGATQF
jgi:hypothetical protein